MNFAENKNTWFQIAAPNRQAQLRLFCFPYAGGDANVFRQWHQYLPAGVEVVAVQYPGRGSRITENPIDSCEEMVSQLYPEMLPLLDKPFMFFGHSNGALISFELARAFQDRAKVEQLHQFISARRAPQVPFDRAATHDLPYEAFKKEVSSLGGTPQEVLDNDELFNIYLPVLRADFSINETYHYSPGPRLTCGATLLFGTQDEDVPVEDMERWQELFEGQAYTHGVSGDHFFLNSNRTDVLSLLKTRLNNLLNSSL